MITEYKGFRLHTRPDGSVDAACGSRWFNRPSMRSAKWAVSVYTRINNELEDCGVRPHPTTEWHASRLAQALREVA